MKRTITILLALLMIISLFGCASSKPQTGSAASEPENANNAQATQPENKEPVTISVWFATATPDRIAMHEKYAAKFMEQNPDIKVEILGVPGDPNDFIQKCDMALAAGEAPDVGLQCTAHYIQQGALEPLDTYFENSILKDELPESVVDSIRANDRENNHLYGIQAYAAVNLFWMRANWFKEAGLPIPETWGDFFTDVEKLTDKENGRYGLSIRGGSGSAQNLEFLMFAYSGITDYFDENGKCNINDPLNVEFAEKYLGCYNVYTPEDDLTKGWTELAATFQSGKAAIVGHNLGSASGHAAAFNHDFSQYQAVPFPKSVKGYSVHASLLVRNGLTINANSQHKDEAWRYIVFYMTDPEYASEICRMEGSVPMCKTVAASNIFEDEPYFQSSLEYINDPELRFFNTPNWLPDYDTVWAEVAQPGIQEVMAGKRTAQDMLDEWAAAMEEAYAEYMNNK